MIDLHCHSIFSDGELTPQELIKKAEKLKLSYFSITDHDNCFAYENMDIKSFNGILVPGVEITTSFEKNIIEIIGYGVKTEKINEWSRKNKEKDLQHAEFIYNNLIEIFNKEGISYTIVKNKEQIIKGKIKQYFYQDLLKYEENKNIIGMEVLSSYTNFCKKGLNNPNSILFVKEYMIFPKIEEVVDLIHECGGLCFLAHLYQYNVDNHINFFKRMINKINLDGIETYHSSFSEKEIIEINKYADKQQLYKSGGSDYHGKLKPKIELGLNLQISEEIIKPWINKVSK